MSGPEAPDCGGGEPERTATGAGARVSRQGFSTGWSQSLVVGACERVMSIHRSDGQCRPTWRGLELFRWRGGFRDEYVPTTCCTRGGEVPCSRPWPDGRVRAARRNARPSRPPAPRQRGVGGSGRRRGTAERAGAVGVLGVVCFSCRASQGCGWSGGGVCADTGGGGLLGQGCQGRGQRQRECQRVCCCCSG